MSTTLIKASVGHLVGYVLRSGSLGGGAFTSSDRLVEGTRGHQKVQQTRPAEYQMEVAVSYLVETEDLALEISGRIDGVLADESGVLIEEIKTTYGELDPERPDNPVHWAQAKTYAYIVAAQNDLETIDVQLTYVQLDSWELQEDRRTFDIEELSRFFGDLVARYLRWAQAYHEWGLARDASIAALEFPYSEYRPGQRPLAVATYRAVENQGRLFAQAPTGIGKTISALFPAIKAMGQGHVEKIFYLTAKTVGRTVAEKALDDLRAAGLKFKSLTLTARDKICFKPDGEDSCDPEQCEFAIGYFDRVNDALEDIFQEDALTRTTIEEKAMQHRICPFEFSLDLSLWVDAVICDYNYVFDPRAYLKRFFQDNAGNYAFLIDEAHNLVDRAREMFSAELYKTQVQGLRRAVAKDHPKLGKRLDEVNKYFNKVRKLCDGEDEAWIDQELPRELLSPLEKLTREAEDVLKRNLPSPYFQDLIEFYFEVLGFLRIAELFDAHYTTYAEKIGKDVRLKLFCIDPSEQIRQALKRGTSATFFSATLTPLDYFRDILGGEQGDKLLVLESPFPRDNLQLLVADHIGTTFKQRAHTYDEVAAAIAAATSQRPGNYLAFFPSYRYMEEVAEYFIAAYPQVQILVQETRMSEPAREAFLAGFASDNQETLVGFAVMGGIFGEGIDLVGERLVGAVVVGVGLPQICLERNLIRAYFDAQEIDGFNYSYTYPGMNRVLQAAGRVIRSAEDRGVVLLIDQRFGQSRYQRLFPPGWQAAQQTRSSAQVGQVVETFWKQETVLS